MKAVVCHRYGSPDVLGLAEVPEPVPGDDDVLIRVRAAAVSPEDCVGRRGHPLIGRVGTGLTKPRRPIPGAEFAGDIEAIGAQVSRVQVGDRVFGTTGTRFGAYAEYVTMPATGLLAPMPSTWGYEQAARVCGPLTAWNFLVDKAKVHHGQSVLVNGASGTVGIAAIQIAKHLGADVTAVCSTAHLDVVETLGADAVIDYTTEDFTRGGRSYDVVFDAVGKTTYPRCKAVLAPAGMYLSTVLTIGLVGRVLWTSVVGARRAMYSATGLRSVSERLAELGELIELIEAGQLTAVVDRSYQLEQIAQAHTYVEQGHKTGNVVITP